MSNFSGFTNAGLQLGLQTLIIKPAKRGLYNIRYTQGSDQGTLADILAQATLEERHTDELEVTDHPVQQGSNIADHAYKRPAEVTLKLAWSNSPTKSSSLINAGLAAAAAVSPVANVLAQVAGGVQAVTGLLAQSEQNLTGLTPSNEAYATLLYMQEQRALFDIYTGRRHYTNMIIKSLSVSNDFKTENSLFVTMTCRQIILVNTETVMLTKGAQKNPQKTAGIKQTGQKKLKGG